MSRCDYDGVFYRVFCVTLLATAFTFTVILTNVFIDIDGLLSKKAKQNHENGGSNDYTQDTKTTNAANDPTVDNVYEKNYIEDESETSHRTKRSLDPPIFFSHLKSQDIKNSFTDEMQKLLEQLNTEENSIENTNKEVKTSIDLDYPKIPLEHEYTKVEKLEQQGYNYDESERNKKSDKNSFHLAMHSILLQGILGHVDVNDIYKRFNKLVKNFNNEEYLHIKGNGIKVGNEMKLHQKVTKDQVRVNDLDISSNEETKFFEELVKCKKLQEEIMKKKNDLSDVKIITNTVPLKEPELLIKTIIEIKPIGVSNMHKPKFSNFQENGKGLPKFNYEPHRHKDIEPAKISNGTQNLTIKTMFKPKFTGQNFNRNQNHVIPTNNIVMNTPKLYDETYYFKKALEYLKTHTIYNNIQFANTVDKNSMKRLKRQVKVRYENYDATTPRIKPVRKGIRKTDDELYVEIETHFDGSGAKGERKKKLVQNLIDRIQQAIRSDPRDSNKKNLHQHLQVRKRTQNPLKHKHQKMTKKYILHMNSIEHRQLNPINKVLTLKEPPQDMKVPPVENWEQPYNNPNSFTMPNIDNSVEISNTNSDYNNVLSSGVPQRVQVPLNTHNANIDAKPQNSFTDTGNVTLFIKDIDGSGFSVGFNQYVDEPPDGDSMKLFSGLENLIKTYHENYDQNNNENNNANEIDDSFEKQHDLKKRNVGIDRNEHVLLRRSVQELDNEDYHSNAYNIILDNKISPYDNYEDILQRPNQKLSSNYEYKVRNYNYNPKNIKIVTKDIEIKALPVVLDEDKFDKKLKPYEMFSLESLLLNNDNKRKKRSMNVQKITNLKSRIKLNRYLNTNNMKSRNIFKKNKRNKRAVDKIRIIASDHLHNTHKNSDENIFLLSGENVFTNRAVLREIELPESDTGDEGEEEHNDEILPYTYDEPNPETSYVTNIFGAKYRHNSLMSKYPHIFTGGMMESKEVRMGKGNEYLLNGSNKPQFKLENLLGMQVAKENDASREKDIPIPEIVNAIMPSPSKNNYKVTVKILPKNLTNAPSGFKERHTVINKTYNNNGVQYYSQVNVSEISKIEKINKTVEVPTEKTTTQNQMQEEENNMKLLLALQKEKIEEQLKHLNQEKEGLETILRGKDVYKKKNLNNMFNEFVHLEPHKHDNMLLVHDPYISHLQLPNSATIEHTTTSTSFITEKNPTPAINVKVEPNKDPETVKVTTSIKENEHLTNEILSKINRNTDILQSFLQKLSEKLDQQQPQIKTTQHTYVEHMTEESQHLRAHVDASKDWGLNLHHMHDSFFNDHLSSKNDTHYAIPFVYAYQHPYLPPNKAPLPMAKIVYHGHIHTNAVHKHPNDLRKYNANNAKPNHSTANGVTNDGTKFFIDALARDAVVAPPKHVQNTEFQINSLNATKIH